jgi:hypothetical protein
VISLKPKIEDEKHQNIMEIFAAANLKNDGRLDRGEL